MISSVEIKNFRILRDIKQDLGRFNILIGPNSTGKSTFLDAIAFVKDVLNNGPKQAVEIRTSSFYDLLWDDNDPVMKICLELDLPQNIKNHYRGKSAKSYVRSRYELEIGINPNNGELQILHENLFLLDKQAIESPIRRRKLQLRKKGSIGIFQVIGKNTFNGEALYLGEINNKYSSVFKLGFQKSALANLVEDEKLFPAAVWTKNKLKEGIQPLTLNSQAMKKPCHPVAGTLFDTDGSNLPIVVQDLAKANPKRHQLWISHLRTALPYLNGISVKNQEWDRFLYLNLVDTNKRAFPSWVLSDGTLRLLALTVLAYLPDNANIYLIEEPENGVHPRAIEAIYQSLTSVYKGQVLVTTHSPVLLSISKPNEVLCFSRKTDGEAQILRGDQHPSLKYWKGNPNLGVVFASGVLE